jgi:ribosomal protein S7
MTDEEYVKLLKEARNHLTALSPHARERKGGELIEALANALMDALEERDEASEPKTIIRQ